MLLINAPHGVTSRQALQAVQAVMPPSHRSLLNWRRDETGRVVIWLHGCSERDAAAPIVRGIMERVLETIPR